MPRYKCDCYLDLNKLVYNYFHKFTWTVNAAGESDAVGQAKFLIISDIYPLLPHLIKCICKKEKESGGGGG